MKKKQNFKNKLKLSFKGKILTSDFYLFIFFKLSLILPGMKNV
jgi:hypothetical protein